MGNFKLKQSMNKFKILILILLIMFFMGCNNKNTTTFNKEKNEHDTLEFFINEKLSSKDYLNDKGYFPKDGLVPTAEVAFQLSEYLLINLFGKETIEEQKPFSVNLENDIWLIEGTLEEGYKGGVAYIEIRKKNGEILKVTHSK